MFLRSLVDVNELTELWKLRCLVDDDGVLMFMIILVSLLARRVPLPGGARIVDGSSGWP